MIMLFWYAFVLVGTLALGALALLFNFLVAPLRTLAWIIQKIAGAIAVLDLALLAVAGIEVGFGNLGLKEGLLFGGVLAACIVVGVLTQWFIERPTRLERREAEAELRRRDMAMEDEIRRRMADRWDRTGGGAAPHDGREVIDTTVAPDPRSGPGCR
ncbi:hypothetical protein Uis1B_2172 [Bifidobacterium margollesii]|uniref:Uncharacterized protein n=1 Tax=Bifidobacterium margollesii TaxID=2020964 RepID=A0A2N5J702_9BIFI|nr:hypothetical protein [Bifidobacterium margollesii]PLS29990.1 hypothetical protein Uis1B_2172 [Bifidobacterium margollesii]